jgi:hypothetical protein
LQARVEVAHGEAVLEDHIDVRSESLWGFP